MYIYFISSIVINISFVSVTFFIYIKEAFVCLSAGLIKKVWTDCDETWRKCGRWFTVELFKFSLERIHNFIDFWILGDFFHIFVNFIKSKTPIWVMMISCIWTKISAWTNECIFCRVTNRAETCSKHHSSDFKFSLQWLCSCKVYYIMEKFGNLIGK